MRNNLFVNILVSKHPSIRRFMKESKDKANSAKSVRNVKVKLWDWNDQTSMENTFR
jgi:hypothetical protein